MKHVFICLSLVLALFSGCEETPPFIDFTDTGDSDTGTIADTIPPAQHKAVLIEDITGVRCVNCPSAAQKIMDIITNKSEDSVIAIALYPWPYPGPSNFINTNPWEGFPKLADDTCSKIVESLGVPNGLPSGYVDRYAFPPSLERPNAFNSWASLVDKRLRLSTPVNITLEKSVAGKKISIDIKLHYTKFVSGKHKLALYLIEDNIISKQRTPPPVGDKDDYVHNHAFRFTFDLPAGRPLKGNLFPGKTYDRHYEYQLPVNSPIKIENCHVVCLVLDATTEEVVNVRKIELQ